MTKLNTKDWITIACIAIGIILRIIESTIEDRLRNQNVKRTLKTIGDALIIFPILIWISVFVYKLVKNSNYDDLMKSGSEYINEGGVQGMVPSESQVLAQLEQSAPSSPLSPRPSLNEKRIEYYEPQPQPPVRDSSLNDYQRRASEKTFGLLPN